MQEHEAEDRRPDVLRGGGAARSAKTSARRFAMRFGVVQDAGVHKYVDAGRDGHWRSSPSGRICLDVHRARHRRRQRVRVARRFRPRHPGRARPGRRTRRSWPAVLGHEIGARRPQAHHQRHPEEQGGQAGQPTRQVGRAALLAAAASAVYDSIIENASIAATSSTPTRSRSQLAQKAGYTPATLADFLTRLAERNKSQTGAQRPVRVAPRDQGADRPRSVSWRHPRRPRPSSSRATKPTSSTAPTEITSIAVGGRRLRGPDRIGRQGAGEEGRAEEGRLGLGRLEADGRAGATDRRRCPLPEAPEDSVPIAPRRAASNPNLVKVIGRPRRKSTRSRRESSSET